MLLNHLKSFPLHSSASLHSCWFIDSGGRRKGDRPTIQQISGHTRGLVDVIDLLMRFLPWERRVRLVRRRLLQTSKRIILCPRPDLLTDSLYTHTPHTVGRPIASRQGLWSWRHVRLEQRDFDPLKRHFGQRLSLGLFRHLLPKSNKIQFKHKI